MPPAAPRASRSVTESLFRCVLQTRWHELDGSRVARPRVLMDWMEHARSMIPSDDPLHDGLDYGLARAIRLDTLTPVEGPVDVAVAVWVSHCGQTSYAIDHELTRRHDGRSSCGRGWSSFGWEPTAVPPPSTPNWWVECTVPRWT